MSAGSRLGPYEILSPLGAGGMGEIYRARDTKLSGAKTSDLASAHDRISKIFRPIDVEHYIYRVRRVTGQLFLGEGLK